MGTTSQWSDPTSPSEVCTEFRLWLWSQTWGMSLIPEALIIRHRVDIISVTIIKQNIFSPRLRSRTQEGLRRDSGGTQEGLRWTQGDSGGTQEGLRRVSDGLRGVSVLSHCCYRWQHLAKRPKYVLITNSADKCVYLQLCSVCLSQHHRSPTCDLCSHCVGTCFNSFRAELVKTRFIRNKDTFFQQMCSVAPPPTAVLTAGRMCEADWTSPCPPNKTRQGRRVWAELKPDCQTVQLKASVPQSWRAAVYRGDTTWTWQMFDGVWLGVPYSSVLACRSVPQTSAETVSL